MTDDTTCCEPAESGDRNQLTDDTTCCEPAESAPGTERDGRSDRPTNHVRERYAEIARKRNAGADQGRDDGADRGRDAETGRSDESGCEPGCGPDPIDPDERSRSVGYEDEDLAAAPDGANMGLGCGNPVAIAALEPGETVLDLGSGGGFDCFLAAREVGTEGTVIGVDMTPEMVERARENARESELDNVEFRLGEIEHLPVADESVDAIISNCVINLSAEKRRALAEARRVLRPGGRLAISDLVATEPLPDAVRRDPDLVSGCVGGVATVEEFEAWLAELGFADVEVIVEGEWDGTYEGESLPIVSARIEATKPT
ncbi:arsenite methyltransferase [Halovivax sp.]|uniref:arsenite methyltransferase n=1 Tax=Halovivax sp. TaxID=1935978 RepID=UPI0025C03943|nr:arsenite methyltransferase [Halovivax sp.]